MRVRVPPHRIRMGRDDGHLVGMSETGALAHAARPQAPDHQAAVEFELGSRGRTLIRDLVARAILSF